jgi:hypothetical protein
MSSNASVRSYYGTNESDVTNLLRILKSFQEHENVSTNFSQNSYHSIFMNTDMGLNEI